MTTETTEMTAPTTTKKPRTPRPPRASRKKATRAPDATPTVTTPAREAPEEPRATPRPRVCYRGTPSLGEIVKTNARGLVLVKWLDVPWPSRWLHPTSLEAVTPTDANDPS